MENHKLIVLIVDDSLFTNIRMEEMLKELENVQQVLHAGSFEEGISLVNRESPDIVLLDINLPDMSGIELLKLIKEKYPAMRVVMVSNQAYEYHRELCKSLGALQFFDKTREFHRIPELISGIN
ncbi:MAG TPA: response regulator transcription factor [Puia sp.]|nr:response regulator transcription factor [Puia sp.]